MNDFDVAIVGAGPAGLFAAIELVKTGSGKLNIALIDKGFKVEKRICPITAKREKSLVSNNDRSINCQACPICHIMYGIGGAGTLSSGIINLRPDVGGDLDKLLGDWMKAEELINYIDKLFMEFGAPEDSLIVPNDKKSRIIERLAAKAGAKYIPTPQRVLGTDVMVKVISNITGFLEKNEVKIMEGTDVKDLKKENGQIKLITDKGEIFAKKVLLAPGRGGARWFHDLAQKIGIDIEPGPLDIGVRVEIPYYITEHITSINHDPKIVMYTKFYDDKVRTFCTNPHGFVLKEYYDDGTVGVNGETYKNLKSKNTNFALLVTLKLTDPYSDVLEFGKSIAKMATKVGMGKPIVQRVGDLEKGRRSTWERIGRSVITPTLKSVTPGDISLILPYRVVSNILEALSRLEEVYPGVSSPQTLLYAPEIKYYGVKAKVTPSLETNIDNIYVAGDGAGLSRGINVAASTGVIAARAILGIL
ncbi:NAD(P)/FAD-dependent oxidoreductase [Fervidicoccus fontis]|uniref:NAD(P)/FAD-dependent oxidoreductase n=1 Tax=Fervidicoccus fontis TaxID=683846 RepID=A0A843ADL2_9CREN|nr:NAD(P)/FAD-dependent oxidoreductase [Fervidicoccus fontis]MBE9391156.1 NAD(P)/FAD-dependent oxidoreductase [Fervidicoccus fontis]